MSDELRELQERVQVLSAWILVLEHDLERNADTAEKTIQAQAKRIADLERQVEYHHGAASERIEVIAKAYEKSFFNGTLEDVLAVLKPFTAWADNDE